MQPPCFATGSGTGTYLRRLFFELVFISEMAKGKKNRKGDESDEG